TRSYEQTRFDIGGVVGYITAGPREARSHLFEDVTNMRQGIFAGNGKWPDNKRAFRIDDVDTVRREKRPGKYKVRSLRATGAGPQQRTTGNAEPFIHEGLMKVAGANMNECVAFLAVDWQRRHTAT